MLDNEELLEQKSALLNIKRVYLADLSIDPTVISFVPEDVARKYVLLPISYEKNRLYVAMADPTNRKALDDVTLYSGCQVEPLLAGTEEIKVAIRQSYALRQDAENTESQLPQGMSIWKVEEEGVGQEGPIIRLIDSLFRQAVMERASDIHWEPRANEVIVRFRIDGIMETKAHLPIELARSIAARLKVMASMDVTERRIPQDGRILLDVPEKRIDIRVSTFTTVYGEKVVTRLLDEDTAQRSLAELGMRQDIEQEIRKLIKQPHGLILVSGPTGSGKTTTLYALLREIQKDIFNIVSIEDPVEYRLPGVNQAQVNVKIGIDFASGLRAILRQDPDVIMVGEIRDKETARIAVTSALTGHLVLTTVHTNTAAEALARMLDMGIEPYLLAVSIRAVLSQRLIRRLCPHCKKSRELSLAEQESFPTGGLKRVCQPVGCSKCRGTGYVGRLGIHEYLPYTQDIKELILQKRNVVLLEKACQDRGMITIREDALQKLAMEETSPDEVFRLFAGV